MNPERGNLWKLLLAQFGPLLALLFVFVLFAVLDAMQPDGGQFRSLRNLQTMLISSAPVMVAALGMTVIIIAGGIDLSVGTAVSFCATVMAWMLLHGWPVELTIGWCLLTGCIVGCTNGILISALRFAPFIVTLGTMTAC